MLDKIFDSNITKIIGFAILGFIVIGLPIIATVDFESSEEKSIEQQFDSLTEYEQEEQCFHFGTTPTADLAEEGTYNGWTRDEVYEIVIPKMDELCGFDFR